MGKDSFTYKDTKEGVNVSLGDPQVYLLNSGFSKINGTPDQNPAQALACVAEMFRPSPAAAR